MFRFCKRKWSFFALILILAIAAFFRLWQLDAIPPGLYPDVALNGNEALDTIKTGDFKVFYPENNGREGLMMWLIALSFSVFGVSVWSIKIVAALAGILTVLGLYLLVKEILQTTSYKLQAVKIALLASFFLATSFWHTLFSRIGFRAILLPLVSVFAFYFLFKGFNTKKIWPFLLSGVFFGLGFYTYSSYRMIILLLPLLLICLAYFKKDKKLLFSIFFFLFSIFLVALPLGLYFFSHPQDFMSRMTGVSVFAQENPIFAFGESLIKHLGMFNVFGDPNWRHNFAGSPMLFWPIGILFLIGLGFSLKEIYCGIKKKVHLKAAIHLFILLWFLVMLLPGILTAEGLPHGLRVVGVIPAVYIFAALGAYLVYELSVRFARKRKLFIALYSLLLILAAFSEFNKYFFTWAKNPNVSGAFTQNYAEIGNYLNSLPDNVPKYVIVNEGGVAVPWPSGLPVPAQTPMFIERMKFGEPRAIYLKPDELDKIKDKENSVIIFMRPGK